MSKIYTRGGDKGESRLIGGLKVPKDHERLQAYGGCDELNCLLGWALVSLGANQDSSWQILIRSLGEIQNHLFVVGGLMACEDLEFRQKLPQLPLDSVSWLESLIDQMSLDLQPLKNFILPGGSELSARLHMARSLCRRVERDIVALRRVDPESVPESIIPYINRLSDFLFTAARYANHLQGLADTIWIASDKSLNKDG